MLYLHFSLSIWHPATCEQSYKYQEKVAPQRVWKYNILNLNSYVIIIKNELLNKGLWQHKETNKQHY